MLPTNGLAKNWLTKRSINFYFAIQLLYQTGRHKFGNRNNNELLIINLASVRADEFQLPVHRQALGR